jgi:hypothetical protein
MADIQRRGEDERLRERTLKGYQDRLIPTGPLRTVLLLMVAWDLLGAVLQLMFDTSLLSANAQPSGILAGRGYSGALFVTAALYLIAARNPVRYRFILWLAVFEQLVAIGTGIFHGARGDLKWTGEIIPVGVAIAFLVLLLLNFPRGEAEEMAPLEVGEAPSATEGAPHEE